MAITATTLSGAMTATDTVANVASATGITAGNFATGSGLTFLKIDQELIFVFAVSGTAIGVVRGVQGTPAQAHVVNSLVQIGGPGDFPLSTLVAATADLGIARFTGWNLPFTNLAGSADAIPVTGPGNYVVKTAGVNAMTIATPTATQENMVISVYSDTANAHTITAASACVAAGMALKTVITFPAFRGAGVILRACNLTWHTIACGPGGNATAATGGTPIGALVFS